MNQSLGAHADAQHPWIGLASFTEGDRSFFAGRGDEIDDLLRLVRRDVLTLLYGVSGLGKTSLVQAGLFPAVREENMLPVPIRLDYLEGANPLSQQIVDAIGAAAVAARVEAPLPRPNETLWEYFHREGNHFWSARNDLVTPFLAFDQFEEFFTLGRETPARAARAGAFMEEFADLVENRPPAALRDDPSRAKGFNFKPVPLKVLLAMREDYLADLDRIRSHFRALGQNRLRLLPMGERQARQVIALGAPLLAPGVEDRIVQYVAGGTADPEMTVAPALLSLVLRELNERRLARGPDAKITSDLLDVEQQKIFEDFYLRTLADFPPGVGLFIEDELLTASGHRNSAALDDALTRPDVTLPVLNELVNRRLLAYEDRHNTRRVELTHDVLVPVIKANRDSRHTREALAQAERLREEQVAQRRKQHITFAIACGLAAALLATLWGGYYLFVQEHKAYFIDFTKRNGFPIGASPISEEEARHRACSILLIHKGITWEGWRPHWKPAFRMVAVDSRLKPTTNHNVGTYLWRRDSEEVERGQSQSRGERLGLHTICQWEFVSNANGEIIYERALDRDGVMVSGFIYSPPGSGPASTRLARFVGPDGFPQLQRSSQAEYVLIHYDQSGWEDRITYRDGKNLPAAGPDGAFGQSMSHNSRGEVTQLLSLGADGKNVIDNVGNCGMIRVYNDKGLATEMRSIGPDLKPMPVKYGWCVAKNEYDSLGRWTRTAYYGVKGEPVLHQDGNHALEAEYDEHGNEITTRYLGLDGKPTLLGSGVAIFHATYNGQGKVARMTYHGVNNEPVLHNDGYHGWESKFDERGNTISSTYFGLDGKPTIIAAGYASFTSKYDSRGRRTRQSYYGVNGEPLFHKDGNHAWECAYDENGNEILIKFLGADEKPVLIQYDYAILRRKFDSDGNEVEGAYFDADDKPTRERESQVHRFTYVFDGRGKVIHTRYWGPDGEPCLRKDGSHGWDGQYDERGNLTVTTYVGLDEKPIALPSGYAVMTQEFDSGNHVTRLGLFGVNGEPVLSKEGYQSTVSKYDNLGRLIEKTYLDRNKPILLPTGYATEKYSYDVHGKTTELTFYGVKGEPVLHQEARYHGWHSEFDERGNEIAIVFVGVDRKPTVNSYGYATRKSTYNARGQLVKVEFFGTNGEPALYSKTYHGYQSQFDERGNETVRTYLGLDGKPAAVPSGYVTEKYTYDIRGNALGVTYHGLNDEPVMTTEGYHSIEATYDLRGRRTSKVYRDLDGKEVQVKTG